ncbi:phosphoinositide 5-phosphatase [Carpediemonas membranifera]|uniref:Phosphoinositide 5-phosphatase n=1 Tax=Carpediemonas membranifera TaxID=201153 RepID=A0A8J6E2Y5_9EUKA|nr:phosphoinositide 5-phosphatase [Carpediemonas membranifera]|eukprot:KAG9392467.1 phosphoinositide 5-phosphatase [Carpediemonas membranifera]
MFSPRSGRETWPQSMQNDVVVHFITWNMNGALPLQRMIDGLFASINSSINVVVFATQESVNSIERSILFRSKDQWIRVLTTALGDGWTLVAQHGMQALHIAVYVRDELDGRVTCVQPVHIPTGPAGLATKGCVAVGLCISGTPFMFMGSHFTAFQEQVAARNADYTRTYNELPVTRCPHQIVSTRRTLRGINPLSPNQGRRSSILATISPLHYQYQEQETPLSRFDNIIWGGDFNYRCNVDRDEADALIAHRDLKGLLDTDQLAAARFDDGVFEGFVEPKIAFLPTYKFDSGSNIYDTSSKRRIPSFCDRVLFRSRAKYRPVVEAYTSHPNILWSDHRPVSLTLRLSLTPEASEPAVASPRAVRRTPKSAWGEPEGIVVSREIQRRSTVCCAM